MYAIAIAGQSGTTEATDLLVEHLAQRGTVGRVSLDGADQGEAPNTDTANPTQEPPDAGSGLADSADRAYWLPEEGNWVAAGKSLSIDDVLDRFARTCDYAVVEGGGAVRLPTVVIGDREVEEGKVLARAPSAGALDVQSVVDALADVDQYETLGSLVSRVKESADEEFAGAIATFTGRVRAKEHEDDDPTEYLGFERYDSVAAEKMATIREELESRDGVYEVALHHKTGVVEAGEDIVFVVVLAGHRTEAFRTVEDGINRLKEEVPLFKKEVTVNDEFWAHTGQRE